MPGYRDNGWANEYGGGVCRGYVGVCGQEACVCGRGNEGYPGRRHDAYGAHHAYARVHVLFHREDVRAHGVPEAGSACPRR